MALGELRMAEHGLDKHSDIEPLARGKTAQQSVIKIATVDVGYCFHLHSIKKRGPQTLRPKTLFRVGRTLRLDMNLLRGSRIVYQIRRRIQGANSTCTDSKSYSYFRQVLRQVPRRRPCFAVFGPIRPWIAVKSPFQGEFSPYPRSARRGAGGLTQSRRT